jgi:hypothetical protein
MEKIPYLLRLRKVPGKNQNWQNTRTREPVSEKYSDLEKNQDLKKTQTREEPGLEKNSDQKRTRIGKILRLRKGPEKYFYFGKRPFPLLAASNSTGTLHGLVN